MDLRGSFVRGDTASVQSAEGRDRIVKNRFTFFAQIIVVYMIIITSLVQISLRSPDKELWLILLSSSIGYKRERSGSVVECLTRDRRVAGSSLTGVTALWSLSKTHLS